MVSLSGGGPARVVNAFGTASRCFDGMLGPLKPGPRFWTCHCQFLMVLFLLGFVMGVAVLVWVVNFPYLCGGFPTSASCGVCVSGLVRFGGESGCIVGFRDRDGMLRLLKQDCRYHRLREAFSGFYGLCCGLVRFLWWLGVWIEEDCWL